MNANQEFPIHPTDRKILRGIPWQFVAPHERQARRNHSQSLATLAQRGGLSIRELFAVLTDRDYHDIPEVEYQSAEVYIRCLVTGESHPGAPANPRGEQSA